ncbi:phage baseplate assembly protein V [Herbaspirillum rubrisubalbicans]|uniref:Bacteriophage Mu Gp45 N-terminal domain-containing protein n=1 Tax=Herbaspirillum rubrisubalbicans TaxID=80842 RepID=A0ABX9BYQ2_9BURK|nr:phage baseplate assembly protein V [Herbaspirillum rubrisubalbicans]RAM63147.1 hypothetical protein RB24_17630 [Herbaspirillum rubrisubalbicans]
MSNDSPIARCTVVLTKPGQRRQRLQVSILDGEGKDDVELFEQYGITSIPLSGAGGLALFFDGDRSHAAIIMPSDKRYRPTDLKPGEVAIYTNEGARIVLKQGRIIEVECDVYRVKAKRYEVVAEEAVNISTHAYELDASGTAKSAGPMEMPEVVVNGISMRGHFHQEHDGPPTSPPKSGGGG